MAKRKNGLTIDQARQRRIDAQDAAKSMKGASGAALQVIHQFLRPETAQQLSLMRINGHDPGPRPTLAEELALTEDSIAERLMAADAASDDAAIHWCLHAVGILTEIRTAIRARDLEEVASLMHQLGYIERHVEARALVIRGAAHAQGGIDGGNALKNEATWKHWSKEADNLREKHGDISKRKLSQMIANKHLDPDDPYYGDPETIRKKI